MDRKCWLNKNDKEYLEMKYRFFFPFLLAGASLGLNGCFADEPANAECDIVKCWVHFDEPEVIFYHAYDTLAGQPVSIDFPDEKVLPTSVDSIVFTTRWDKQVTQPVPLYFQVTPGARIFLEADGKEVPFVNGTPVDLRATAVDEYQVQHFVVRSEDGAWSRCYSVSIQVPPMPSYPPEGFEFNFEDFALNSGGKYYVWTEANPFARDLQWANGNPGFNYSRSSAKPDEYPTVPVPGAGVDGGACLKLTTCDTGGFGKMVNMPQAAGNMFIGTFDLAKALTKDGALTATRFGFPFAHKPQRMRGYYKYFPGPQKHNRYKEPIPGQDICDIYAVFYRNTDEDGNQVQLDGTNVMTSPLLVALARIKSEDIVLNTTEWQEFSIPFEYLDEVDDELVRQKGCSFTICFAASIEGDLFQGAEGSTLWVDNVTLECEY